MNKFKVAFTGIFTGLHHPSILLQFILGFLAMIAGFILQLSVGEWIAVILCMGCVIGAEMLNTCIEKICDMYSKSYSEEIRDIKDIAAGAVLVFSLMALIVAIIILVNHI